jgi:hypothetical protein
MKDNKKQKGQAMVEFAIVLPVLVILLLATIEGGRLFLAKTGADRIARETAEMAGSVGAPTAEVWAYTSKQIGDFGGTLGEVDQVRLMVFDRTFSNIRCSANHPSANVSCRAEYGDWIEVRVSVTVDTWFGNVDLESTHLASAWRASTP